MGGTNDRRYNLSFIIDNSVDMGKPMIGVSIQYRLSGWGFLGGREALEAGATNLGFQDQRLALHWIQENIDAFGGDPSKVTMWGRVLVDKASVHNSWLTMVQRIFLWRDSGS